MPVHEWPLGAALEKWRTDHGLTKRQVADLSHLSEATVRSLIAGHNTTGLPYQTTITTLTKLADGIGFPLDEAIRLAGLEVPAEFASIRSAPVESWTFDEMLAALRGRFLTVSQQAARDTLPPLTTDRVRARMRTVTRLAALADQLASVDPDGAGIIRDLSRQLDAQIEGMNGEVTQTQSDEVH